MGGFASIIPGQSIGNFHLHDTEQEIISKMEGTYKKEERCSSYVYRSDSIMVWVDKKTKEAYQIAAGKGFHGYFKDGITIGSKLCDLKRMGNVFEENEIIPVIMIEGIAGICFEMEDDSSQDDEDDWDEKRIAWISVFE